MLQLFAAVNAAEYHRYSAPLLKPCIIPHPPCVSLRHFYNAQSASNAWAGKASRGSHLASNAGRQEAGRRGGGTATDRPESRCEGFLDRHGWLLPPIWGDADTFGPVCPDHNAPPRDRWLDLSRSSTGSAILRYLQRHSSANANIR